MLTIAIVPAFNEAYSIASVVQLARPLVDKVIVCDNASTDATANLAEAAGAMVVSESRAGYGYACQRGIVEARRLAEQEAVGVSAVRLLFIDGDGSNETADVRAVLAASQHGELIIGARRGEGVSKGAMSWPQRVGNMVAARLVLLLWWKQITDLGPLRAIYLDDVESLGMQEMTFGWTVEMQLRALHTGIAHIEVTVGCKSRHGPSKISGTVAGVVRAAYGIIGTIVKLRWQLLVGSQAVTKQVQGL